MMMGADAPVEVRERELQNKWRIVDLEAQALVLQREVDDLKERNMQLENALLEIRDTSPDPKIKELICASLSQLRNRVAPVAEVQLQKDDGVDMFEDINMIQRNEDDLCKICLECFYHEEVTFQLICGHEFHLECVERLVSARCIRKVCTVCQKPISDADAAAAKHEYKEAQRLSKKRKREE